MFLAHSIFLFPLLITVYNCQSHSVRESFSDVLESCSVPTLSLKSISHTNFLKYGTFGSSLIFDYQDETSATRTYTLKRIPIQTKAEATDVAKMICRWFGLTNATHVRKVFRAGFDGVTICNTGTPCALLAVDVYDDTLQKTVTDLRHYPNNNHHSVYGRNIFYSDRLYLSSNIEPGYIPKWVQWVRNVCFRLALSVKELHSNGILHLDIKPDHFLVRAPPSHPDDHFLPEVVLSNIGMARDITDIKTEVPVDINEFMAPEILHSHRDVVRHSQDGRHSDVRVAPPTAASDIYSLGLTFLTVFKARFPSDVERTKSVTESVLEYKTPYCNDDFQPRLCQLIKWMMEKDPKDRPTIEQVLEHEFLKALSRRWYHLW